MNRHLLGDGHRCLMGQASWRAASAPRARVIDLIQVTTTAARRPIAPIEASLRPFQTRPLSIFCSSLIKPSPSARSSPSILRISQTGPQDFARTYTTRPALNNVVIFRAHLDCRQSGARWSSSGPESPGDAHKSASVPQPASHQDGQQVSTGAKGSAKHLFDRLPHIHRPTKQELLAAATGFWHRLQIRFKWFSIRSARPFNSEEIFTFISWIFWGHVIWIVIGTTTFVSLAILAINTVFAQETLARWVGAHLTKSIGVQIVFENAIVPNWRDGVITFKNVFISRRPSTNPRRNSVSKGSSTSAAAAAALADQERQRTGQPADQSSDPVDDGNYSQFDLTVESISVTLSFAKWFNGKGLLRDVEVRGVRGVVDRTHVKPRTVKADPKSFRREHRTGDFEIDNFRLDDVLLTIHQPGGFRPFQLSVFNCELPRLRKQWLFYDFLSANNMSGSFDNSLFTIHPRQVHGYTGVPLVDGREDEASVWKKHSRLRVDGLKIDHLNRGVEGPFSWIYEGNVDIVADIMLPNDADGTIAKVMSDFYDRMEATVTNSQIPNSLAPNKSLIINHREDSDDAPRDPNTTSPPPSPSPTSAASPTPNRDARFIIFDLNIRLNDVRASVPLFPRELSYVSNALIRPTVAYINSHSNSARGNAFIPINCRIVKHATDFDGSWTLFDSGLLDDVSREIYTAIVRDIRDRKHRQRRIKKVATWAAQVAAQALFIGLAGQLA